MKKLLIGLTLLASISGYACTCMSSKNIIKEDLASWKGNNINDVKVKNLDTTIMPLALYNLGKSIVQADEAGSCDAGCSQYGIRITASVEYLEDGKNCKANLTKPARYESKLFLKNISCE